MKVKSTCRIASYGSRTNKSMKWMITTNGSRSVSAVSGHLLVALLWWWPRDSYSCSLSFNWRTGPYLWEPVIEVAFIFRSWGTWIVKVQSKRGVAYGVAVSGMKGWQVVWGLAGNNLFTLVVMVATDAHSTRAYTHSVFTLKQTKSIYTHSHDISEYVLDLRTSAMYVYVCVCEEEEKEGE